MSARVSLARLREVRLEVRATYDSEFEPTTAARMARNDAIFRDANERIRAAAEDHDLAQGPIPFICECADPGCHALVRLTLTDYRQLRENPRYFVNVRGHEAGKSNVEVVAQGDGFVVIEKLGEAGEIAERLAGGSSELVAPRGDEEGSTGG
jgi:hypothetical protein